MKHSTESCGVGVFLEGFLTTLFFLYRIHTLQCVYTTETNGSLLAQRRRRRQSLRRCSIPHCLRAPHEPVSGQLPGRFVQAGSEQVGIPCHFATDFAVAGGCLRKNFRFFYRWRFFFFFGFAGVSSFV
ncbi:hypothetical protein BJ741DRAFT_627633, partial [Chytriomyces cf. hyalinus JEL632]